jgi:hypothetical protein
VQRIKGALTKLMILVFLGAARAGAQAPTALAAPDTFGLGDQILHVPAAAFQMTGNASPYEFGADGYLRTESDATTYLVAPLVLPAGTQVWGLCTYSYNTEFNWAAYTRLQAVKQAHGTTAPEVVNIREFGLFDNDGYVFACSNFSYTVRNTADVDQDGASEDVAHQLVVGMTDDIALGGVRVFWRHQVSPAPALPSFNDVAPGDPAFKFVEAARSAGVTAGCAGGRYCPDGPWTRRQMAVFLARALGLHWH